MRHFFFCQTNGFLQFFQKTQIQITNRHFFSLSFTNYTKKKKKGGEAWTSVFFYRRSRLQSKKHITGWAAENIHQQTRHLRSNFHLQMWNVLIAQEFNWRCFQRRLTFNLKARRFKAKCLQVHQETFVGGQNRNRRHQTPFKFLLI